MLLKWILKTPVQWQFLFDELRAMHFPDLMIAWVKECVCTAHFSIWKEANRRNDIHREVGNWNEGSNIATIETKGSDFKARLRALTLAATVY